MKKNPLPLSRLFKIVKQLVIGVSVICTADQAFGQASTTLSNLVSPTAVNVSLLPAASNVNNLGSSTLGWKNLYLKGNIYFAGRTFIKSKGTANNFFGSTAGYLLTTGTYNTAVGHAALYNTTTGMQNTASGAFTLFNNINGSRNTASGQQALFNNTFGSANTVMGFQAMYSNTTGYDNLAVGNRALFSHQSGCCNIALGTSALEQNISAEANIAIGQSALYRATGNWNTAIGISAAETFSNVSSSTFLGAYTYAADGTTNSTAIGYGAAVLASNQVRIGNPSVTSIGGEVEWTKLSDGRYKKNIKSDVPGLSFIIQLKPITYSLDRAGLYNATRPGAKDALQASTIKAENAEVRYTGFIAQEVEEIAKKLNYDFSGVDKPKNDKDLYGLRYAEFVVPLVKAVQELAEENDKLKTSNAELNARLNKIEAALSMNKDVRIDRPVLLSSAKMEQNIPNPFKQNSLINYYLPDDIENAVIKVSDINGKIIKTIRLTSKGRGQITLQTAQLAAGTYNYTLYVNDKQIDSRQMIVTK